MSEASGAPAAQDSAQRPGAMRAEKTSSASGRRYVILLCLLFLLAGAGCFGYWWYFLRFEESTDDAYVAGNQVRVSPLVSGTVMEIFVDDTEGVGAGALLLRLDDTDARLAYDQARAALADAVRGCGSLMAESDRLASLVELRSVELARAQGDWDRREDRKTRLSVSDEEWSHARDNLAIARKALRVAEEDLRRQRLLLHDSPLHEQPQVLLAAEQLREAWLALRRCEIRSPVDGYVAKRSVQVGMRVTAGTPLMAVVPLDRLWVDANFKEVQLGRMRIGQPAKIKADMYGSSVIYAGRVAGFSAGTGSSFSLLPPENATGNWIKVVQRVPVRIEFEPEAFAARPLLVGLSCTVYVDVSDEGGSMRIAPSGADSESAPRFATSVPAYDMTEINREIREIIDANAE
ncbi:efflux RND transporter periplasmic adaptor subunit [Desulfovibrio sp. OttesenSCG-928-A18]|nr:efflux RND transporter periplasmic adaptor subunit [Desulfovibrio sp. OttesenSCG-928-A18]